MHKAALTPACNHVLGVSSAVVQRGSVGARARLVQHGSPGHVLYLGARGPAEDLPLSSPWVAGSASSCNRLPALASRRHISLAVYV